jgi:hypothetical protein
MTRCDRGRTGPFDIFIRCLETLNISLASTMLLPRLALLLQSLTVLKVYGLAHHDHDADIDAESSYYTTPNEFAPFATPPQLRKLSFDLDWVARHAGAAQPD